MAGGLRLKYIFKIRSPTCGRISDIQNMESMSALLANWRQASDKMKKLSADTPRIIGNECMKSVKENFALQGYDSGYGVEPWDKRSEKTDKAYDRGKYTLTRGPRKGQQSKYRTGANKTFKGSVYSSQNPILEQTRNLYNSVTYSIAGNQVFTGVLRNTRGPVLQYAKKMNEGGNGTPARKYIPKPDEPPNPKMLKKVKKKIEFERGRAMAGFVNYR